MFHHDDGFLLRKEKIGWLAVISWILAFWLSQGIGFGGYRPFLPANPQVWAFVGWIAIGVWIAMDASYRRLSFVWWTILWVVTGPLGLAIYLLKRPPMPVKCYRCGSALNAPEDRCRSCCYRSYAGRIRDFVLSGYADFLHSFSNTPSASSRRTIAYMAVACGVFGIFGFLHRYGFFGWLGALALPIYWVLVAYWVYLDAKWRRMEPLPWTALVLLSNLVGLVTYLVIRHRDPVICPQCQAMLNVGLKHCPYCGAATESVCPRCQATVQPGWVFCPACAAQLPVEAQSESSQDASASHPATVSVRGCVTDSENGMPLTGVEVRIDSKTINVSATTDPVGRYLMVDLDPRPYVLIASIDGYVPQTRTFEPNATKSDPVNFSLQRKPS